jgi:CheY-like chemotaxis protein
MASELFADRHILVVEDEMIVLMLIEEMLADLGCASVTAAATVGQALNAIDAKVFDAALLDVNLNGTKSYPIADALAVRGVPFLFATGYSDHALKGGYPGRPVLSKPFQFQQLVDGLTHLLLDSQATVL